MVGDLVSANLWFIPFIALAIQIITTVYFFKIRRFIGKNLRLIFTGFHVLGYAYIAFMVHALFLAGELQQTAPLEVYAAFFGLIYPCFNGLLHLGVKRTLFQGMKPNTKREVQRDMERDYLRDPIRDERRDKRKAMEHHVENEEQKKEQQEIRDEEREEYKEEDRLTRVVEMKGERAITHRDAAKVLADTKKTRVVHKEEDRLTRVDERVDNKEEDRVTRVDERVDNKEEDRLTRVDELKDERDIRHTDELRREKYEGDIGKVARTHLEESDDPESTREEEEHEQKKEEERKE